jgi:hypothetical protein
MDPFTHEELESFTNEQINELLKSKSPRLYPYCLIGLPLDEARIKLSDWWKGRCDNVELLVSGKEMDMGYFHKMTWFCCVDENNIITNISSGWK